MMDISIIGCGFVADLYMRSFCSFPDIQITAVYDRDQKRATEFGKHWSVPVARSFEELLRDKQPDGLILNLTNPSSHYEITNQSLRAGFHVYTEKPLAMEMGHAQALYNLAKEQNLMLASAPCSVLGESCQILLKAIQNDVIGQPRLVYAELDDGFLPQAPHQDWRSESGARWPAADEFRTGCTIEHAGYYLTWLVAMFGPVKRVVAASASVLSDILPSEAAPDVSIATLFFENGVVARLTCSIVAPHDHSIRIIGDRGVLKVKQAWQNRAPVRFHRRFTVRRRLLEHPIGKRLKPDLEMPPSTKRVGAATMNFALGPVEMVRSRQQNRACRLSSELALHLNEITLAIQNAGYNNGIQTIQSRCDPMELVPWCN